ncbi:MAG: hypothetical protein ACFCVE_14930 [Phycisphaerae bacterium]
MLQAIIQLLPQADGAWALALAVGGLLAGGVLWLAGAWFTRALTTLAALAVGAVLGWSVPAIYHLNLTPGVTAIAGALAVGCTGYYVPRFWLGIYLGLAMAVWTGLLVWTVTNAGSGFGQQYAAATASGMSPLRATWFALPLDTRQWLAACGGTAAFCGMAGVWLWPRAGELLTWSLIGLTMASVTAVFVVSIGDPTWLGRLPAFHAQLMAATALAALGMLIQWRLLPPEQAGAPISQNNPRAYAAKEPA